MTYLESSSMVMNIRTYTKKMEENVWIALKKVYEEEAEEER